MRNKIKQFFTFYLTTCMILISLFLYAIDYYETKAFKKYKN